MKRFVIALCALLLSATSFAQDVEDKEVLQGDASADLAAIRMASQLLCYGYSNQSALSLVAALQIFSETPTQPLAAEREEGEGDDPVGAKPSHLSFDYATIAADAATFAGADTALLTIIDAVAADAKGASRGAVGGPSIHYDRVKARTTDTYTINFIAGCLAEVLVSGDGDTDLDLYVYDSNGNLIDKDIDYTDDCYVCWIPKWTGRFYIKIVNRGNVYNNYLIATN